MACEAKSYTVGYMIRGYHVYKDIWLSCIGEVLNCCFDERSAEGPFRLEGTAAKQNQNVYSLEVCTCKEAQVNQITRYGTVTHATMTELK